MLTNEPYKSKYFFYDGWRERVKNKIHKAHNEGMVKIA